MYELISHLPSGIPAELSLPKKAGKHNVHVSLKYTNHTPWGFRAAETESVVRDMNVIVFD